jgi:predicted Na+-dependent transporter
MDEWLQTLVKLGLMGSMLGLKLAQALDITLDDLLFARKEPWQLARSLVIIDVFVPIAILLVILAIRPPRATEIGLAIIAAAPAAPLVLTTAVQAGGRLSYIASLQLTLALLAVITTPITLAVLAHVLDFRAAVSPAAVAQQVVLALVLPTMVAMLIRARYPRVADRLHPPLRKIAGALFLAVIVLIAVREAPRLVEFDLRSYVAMMLAVAAALATGQLLGPARPGDRSALALECAVRNPGLAMLIAALNFPLTAALHVLIPYLFVSGIPVALYVRWRNSAKVAEGGS